MGVPARWAPAMALLAVRGGLSLLCPVIGPGPR
jgi:hypothetical protein